MPPRIKNALHVKIGQRIKELRLEANMSQGELAALLNSPNNTLTQEIISYMESGKRPPTVDQLITLQGVFRVSLDYLIMGKGKR